MQYTPWLLGHHVELMEMLDGREHRAAMQKKFLAKEPASLVCLTLNIAGPIKVFLLSEEVFGVACQKIESALDQAQIAIQKKEVDQASYGYEAYWATTGDPQKVKAALIPLEEEGEIGRLFDIDVLRKDGSKVSREDMGAPMRTCILCGQIAAVCARNRTHSVPKLQEETVRRMLSFLRREEKHADFVGKMARMALLHEVYTTPKPGLVDRDNTGSHGDMDVPLFERSAEVLQDYFAGCFAVGRKNKDQGAGELLSLLRPLGIQAEREMFAATGGVNTHKGMIFSLGILCGACGYQSVEKRDISVPAILTIAGEIALPALLGDFAVLAEKKELTAGERQFANLGLFGIRGEAASGFSSLQKYGIPVFGACLASGDFTFEEAGVQALLSLIAHVTDSNMIARSNKETQEKLQMEVRNLLREGYHPTKEEVQAIDRRFISYNVSPGGCADLLAILYFLWLWEQTGSAQVRLFPD